MEEAVPIALNLIEFIVQQEPAVANALRNIFSKTDPTVADWQAEKDSWKASYADLIRSSKIPTAATNATPVA